MSLKFIGIVLDGNGAEQRTIFYYTANFEGV